MRFREARTRHPVITRRRGTWIEWQGETTSGASHETAINQHYGRPELSTLILNGLQAADKDVLHLTPDDLAPVDQFHTGGKQATLDLARFAQLPRGAHVLDIGGGLGGPARTVATELSCDVTVLDLTEEYCQTGQLLTDRVGLGDRVHFRHGTALALPFPEASFDVVWTQHSSMNIEDKQGLYAEVRRVLRPDGRLALHEILAGPVQPVHVSVPWASDASFSFLIEPDTLRKLLTARGFREVGWRDESAAALNFFRRRSKPPQQAASPLGLFLLMGEDSTTKIRNQIRNLEEQRIVIAQGVFG
ncbi:MAG: class I SAM-dependent methyltransferase [Dehalococcoidia bacterium]